ncbi:hypothetical protein BHM03_00053001 [Ensete ventricosum]|nr:hypothetical protein BHM03_00053001 [Ensete ventricosum]
MVDRLQLWPPLLFSSLPLRKLRDQIGGVSLQRSIVGGWPWPGPCRAADHGLATCKRAIGCGQGPLQGCCWLRPGQPARAVDHGQQAARPWLACDRGCPQGAVARRGDTCRQKLSPERATARRSTRRGGAHGGAARGHDAGRKGAARPLAGRLSAGKGGGGRRRIVRVREEG